MNTTAPRTLNPQILGQAENAHRAALDRILTGTGATYQHWVALKLTAVNGGTADREQLIGRVGGALKLDEAVARTTLTELTAAHLMQTLPGDGSQVGFTDAGAALYHQINTAVDEVVTRVYGAVAAEDLAIAGRVLADITARLNADLSGA